MVISDQLFEAYLKCKTKAYQLFFADTGCVHSLDSISEWQRQIKDDFCRAYVKTLVSDNQNACFIGATTNGQQRFVFAS